MYGQLNNGDNNDESKMYNSTSVVVVKNVFK